MSEPEEYDRKKEFYSDWLSDNKSYLMDEFCNVVLPDEFDDFCREEFREALNNGWL